MYVSLKEFSQRNINQKSLYSNVLYDFWSLHDTNEQK
jgi:hypothetical protein